MKTININLIGETVNTPKKVQLKKDTTIDPRSKHLAITIVMFSSIIFLVSFAIWGIIFVNTKNSKAECKKIEKKIEELKPQLEVMSEQEKDTEKRIKILEAQLLAKDRIYKNMISWNDILTDITLVVPKTVKVKEMSQMTSTKGNQNNIIEIKGQVNANKEDALRLVSYFVLNINENISHETSLKDATIKELKFNSNEDLYDFAITANIERKEKRINQLIKTPTRDIFAGKIQNKKPKEAPAKTPPKVAYQPSLPSINALIMPVEAIPALPKTQNITIPQKFEQEKTPQIIIEKIKPETSTNKAADGMLELVP